jgi:chromosome segregation ATPase
MMKKKAAAKGTVPTKKKDDASAEAAPKDDEEAPEVEEKEVKVASPKKPSSSKDESKPSHTRQPSASQQSRLRSTSFRAAGTSPPLKSPTSGGMTAPLSPSDEAADIYRKQASRIEELEKQVKQLESQAAKLPALEEEVEELRESSSDANANVASLKEKARESDSLKSEVASLKRQNAQLQAQAKKGGRRESVAGIGDDDGVNGGSSGLKAELESKTATIDALELEISALNARATSATRNADDQSSRAIELEGELRKAQEVAELATHELQDLRENLAKQQEEADKGDKKKSEGPDPAALSRKVAQLEAELSSAQRAAALANTRADTQEKKVATLTTLHKESEARRAATQADATRYEREAKELRSRIGDLRTENDRLQDQATRRNRLEAEGDSAGLEELEDEERQRLAAQVRELEAEVFELRRGAWRERRKEMQPGLTVPGEDGDIAASVSSFDEVDLSASYNGASRRQNGPDQRKTSSFADVINSGIRAFTDNVPTSPQGADGRPPKTRKQSLGQLLNEFDDDDDFVFDEDGFRKAQEEEAHARIERVKEIKRGLKKWEGWGLDLADMRAGMGGVFDV